MDGRRTDGTGATDWVAWHTAYDDLASSHSHRLRLVQGHLRLAIDRCPPGPVRLLSLCAGEGRDVLGVLGDHARRDDVHAVLVELDPVLCGRARSAAAAAGLTQVQVREGDAGTSATWADTPPADVVLLCGIFGNVPDADIERTAALSPGLCRDGATLLWTRHRRPPDLTPTVRAWFTAAGFEELAFDAPADAGWISVGVVRCRAGGPAIGPDVRLFAFTA